MRGARNRGHLADAGDAAQDDGGHRRRREQPGHHIWGSEIRLQDVSEGVRLHRVAGDERGEAEGDGEEHRHPPPALAHAPLDVVHRAAGHRALVLVGLGVHVAVALGQRHLRELRGRAEQRRHPHPEQRPRPAVVDRPRCPRDVADAHGGRQSGGEGLEVRHVSRGRRGRRSGPRLPRTRGRDAATGRTLAALSGRRRPPAGQ